MIYFATLDIENHFGSFKTKKLAALLPIPKGWVDCVVSGRRTIVAWDKHKGAPPSGFMPSSKLLLQARQGISLGSINSPIVAAHSTSFLKWALPSSLVLMNYADNFLLLATSASELQGGIEKLTDAVGMLPGGQFNLKLVSQGTTDGGFEFLGHSLTSKGTTLRIEPLYRCQQSILGKLNELDEKISIAIQGKQLEVAGKLLAEQFLKSAGWLAAFRECSSIDEWKVLLETPILQRAQQLNIDPIHLMTGDCGQFEYDDFEDGYDYV